MKTNLSDFEDIAVPTPPYAAMRPVARLAMAENDDKGEVASPPAEVKPTFTENEQPITVESLPEDSVESAIDRIRADGAAAKNEIVITPPIDQAAPDIAAQDAANRQSATSSLDEEIAKSLKELEARSAEQAEGQAHEFRLEPSADQATDKQGVEARDIKDVDIKPGSPEYDAVLKLRQDLTPKPITPPVEGQSAEPEVATDRLRTTSKPVFPFEVGHQMDKKIPASRAEKTKAKSTVQAEAKPEAKAEAKDSKETERDERISRLEKQMEALLKQNKELLERNGDMANRNMALELENKKLRDQLEERSAKLESGNRLQAEVKKDIALEKGPAIKSFKTGKGSMYAHLPDGRYQRFKTANTPDHGLHEPEELTVFISDKGKEIADATYRGDAGEPDINERTYVVENMPGDKPVIRRKRSEIVNPDNLFVAVIRGMGTPKAKFIKRFPASLTPEPGKTVYEYSGADDDGKSSRHVGHEVTDIEYEQTSGKSEDELKERSTAPKKPEVSTDNLRPAVEPVRPPEVGRQDDVPVKEEGDYEISDLGSQKELGDIKYDVKEAHKEAQKEDLRSVWATMMAKRYKDKLAKRNKKIQKWEKSAKQRAEKGWINTGLSALWDEQWATYHKWRGRNLYQAVEHHNDSRIQHENARDNLFNEGAAQIDQMLYSSEERADQYALKSQSLDKEIEDISNEISKYSKVLARIANDEAKKVVQEKIDGLQAKWKNKGEEKREKETLWQKEKKEINKQKSLRQKLLGQAIRPARPDTTPPDYSWLVRRVNRPGGGPTARKGATPVDLKRTA